MHSFETDLKRKLPQNRFSRKASSRVRNIMMSGVFSKESYVHAKLSSRGKCPTIPVQERVSTYLLNDLLIVALSAENLFQDFIKKKKYARF